MIGVGSSSGIGIGKAVLFMEKPLLINEHIIEDRESEWNKFERSIEKAVLQLVEICDITRSKLGDHEAEIFEAHQMMLQDPEWIQSIKNKILEDGKSAEWSVDQTTKSFVTLLKSLDDAYLSARSNDLIDVSERVLRIILNVEKVNLGLIPKGSILITDDLKPSDSVNLNPGCVAGIITRDGSETSHSSIIARTLGIPAVMGVNEILTQVSDGQMVVMNGATGEIIVDPTEDVYRRYQMLAEEERVFKERMEAYRCKPTETSNGSRVELVCNIGRPNDIENVILNDGEGVGLFRSEFIFIDRDQAPTEEEQYQAYRKVLEGMEGKPVIIRTLDAGGDKEIPYLNLPEEMNPFLGFRAIRICLEREKLFKTQLRAILRASVYGTVKIMFPMISTVDEVLEAKDILEQCKKELADEAVAYKNAIEVGIMIEVPSAAVNANALAKYVDFFSIGTNDLIQYTMAADRMNATVKYLYKPTQPALVKLIHHVVKSGHEAGIWVGMCGEAASNPIMIPLLVGMKLDEFSVSPASVLKTRRQISLVDEKSAEALLGEVLQLDRAELIEARINRYIKEFEVDGKENSLRI